MKYHRGLFRAPSLEPQAVTKADIGTLYHAQVQALYEGRRADVEEFIAVAPDTDDKDVAKSIRLVQRMTEGYLQWLADTGSDQGLTIVGVERQLDVPFGVILGEEVHLTGKLDLEVMDEWGFRKIIDHKSVQNLDQADQLYLNDQGRTYCLLSRMEGNPVKSFIHNQARRVLRTGTATPPFYQRVEVSYSDELLDNHEKHLHHTLEQMVYTAQKLEEGWDHHGLVPPNPSKDCGWQCPFVHACPMLDDGSDAEGYLVEFFTDAGRLMEREEGNGGLPS